METVKKWLSERADKSNGLYVHYSPPKLLGVVSGAQLRQWARGGADASLERAVLAGQGRRLLAEAHPAPLPAHLAALLRKCEALHEAVEKGSLLELQELLEGDYNRHKSVMCLDEAGAGLLHKAVFYDYTDIVAWLVAHYPQLVHLKDSFGRTALHYTAACRHAGAAAALLERAGAARGARDALGHTPAHYRARATSLALPAHNAMPPEKPPGLVIKRHNIRIWCHDCDMARLQRVVWEGHGARLLSEVSNRPVVKRFLEAVPYLMNTIRDIHEAVVQNDLEGLMKHAGDPVSPQALSSRDVHNMTVMHKAAGLGHVSIMKYLADRYPQGINDVDNDGRTPLHYAATVRDEQHTYNTLVGLGADEAAVDNKNKTPGYYINRPQEIDKNLLKTVPEAPRTPFSAYPSSWDWKLLDTENIAELNKKSRRKIKASTENLSSKNNTTTVSESIENRVGGMKTSSTHELIKDLPDLDDNAKPDHDVTIDNILEDSQEKEEKEDANGQITEDETQHSEEEPAEAKEEHKENKTDEEAVNDTDDFHKNVNLHTESDENNDNVDKNEDNDDHEVDNKAENDTSKPEHTSEKDGLPDVTTSGRLSAESHEDNISKKDEGNMEYTTNGDVETHKEEHPEIHEINNTEKEEEVEPKHEDHDEEEYLSDKNQDDRHNSPDITQEGEDKHNTNYKEISKENHDEEGKDIDVMAKDAVTKTEEENIATSKEGNNNNAHNEDDDDVQVQGDLNSEYSDTNLRSTAELSDTKSAKRGNLTDGRNTQESLIEGIINGEAELDSQDASITQREGSVHGEELVVVSMTHTVPPSKTFETDKVIKDSEIDPEVTELINTANMEMLAALVLNGEGSRLIGRRSGNSELQAFLDNVSTYMQKINKVHLSAKDGNIRDLQAALDRRKFAIARDSISPNGATPLHVATVFGKTNIMKYLGGRFPETLSAVDFEGRTALHYAAILPDNGHYFNLLQQLGANAKDLDDNGRSAEDYYKNPNLLPFSQLVSDFGMSEEEAQQMLSDKGTDHAANSHMDIPIFRTDEGRYLAKSLGDPLIKGLTEVANVKPKDPVAFLASFLHNFPENEKPRLGTQESNVLETHGSPEVENEQPPPVEPIKKLEIAPSLSRSATRTATRPHRPIDVITVDPRFETSPDAPEAAFSSADRDEHGQSMLHFAAARTHTRNALFQLLQETDVNLAFRDELYRTARDVSLQANVPENTVEIDRWVLQLAARGNKEKIMELFLEGYDHILDIVDDEGQSITEVVANRGDTEMSNVLASIPPFEESREALHSAIRRGDLATVEATLSAEGGRTLARSKSSFGRTALHVAVLAQHEEIVAFLASKFPELLRYGDNLERSPLHYAMGVEKIESLSRVLIRAGAKRVLKDLKGRQPSYYFMNKSEILRLKEEEEVY